MTQTKIKAVLVRVPINSMHAESYKIKSIIGKRTLSFRVAGKNTYNDKCVGDTVLPDDVDRFISENSDDYEVTFKIE